MEKRKLTPYEKHTYAEFFAAVTLLLSGALLKNPQLLLAAFAPLAAGTVTGLIEADRNRMLDDIDLT